MQGSTRSRHILGRPRIAQRSPKNKHRRVSDMGEDQEI